MGFNELEARKSLDKMYVARHKQAQGLRVEVSDRIMSTRPEDHKFDILRRVLEDWRNGIDIFSASYAGDLSVGLEAGLPVIRHLTRAGHLDNLTGKLVTATEPNRRSTTDISLMDVYLDSLPELEEIYSGQLSEVASAIVLGAELAVTDLVDILRKPTEIPLHPNRNEVLDRGLAKTLRDGTAIVKVPATIEGVAITYEYPKGFPYPDISVTVAPLSLPHITRE